jgi:hypothetical protein
MSLLHEWHPDVRDAPSRLFEVEYETTCFLCGFEIERGAMGKYVEWFRRGVIGPVSMIAHAVCPSPKKQIEAFFPIDGDIIVRHFPNARRSNCPRCGLDMEGQHAVQVLRPDTWFMTIHWDCRKTSGRTE